VEASAIHHPAALGRLPVSTPLMRLRSDDQLLAWFRAGNNEAFDVLHDRYRQRLFAYVRQMLSPGSRQDAEDVMQDVFVRAYGSLRADGREMNVRAWLYRVAHNRCIDHLRRPIPPAADVFEVSRKPLQDPVEEAQRREDLARLVADIAQLPEQQRSALLMRELDGMSYTDLAAALEVTVPAVKSLLVRARVGLVDAAEARDADCHEIRDELLAAYDRGVKASARARRHMRGCPACADYRAQLRGVQRSFAVLSPVGFGPVALVAKLLGVGGAGGSAAASGTAAGGTAVAGSGAAAATGGIAAVTACKVAAVVCTAAITAGGAVEANHIVRHRETPSPAVASPAAQAPVPAPVRALQKPTATATPGVIDEPVLPHGTQPPPAAVPVLPTVATGSSPNAVPAPAVASGETTTTPHAAPPAAPADAPPPPSGAATPAETVGPPTPVPTPDPTTGATGAPATGAGATTTPTATASPGDGATPTPTDTPTSSPSPTSTPTSSPTPTADAPAPTPTPTP
jgi:RNA polymerase sigma factor (sigma-70 family)